MNDEFLVLPFGIKCDVLLPGWLSKDSTFQRETDFNAMLELPRQVDDMHMELLLFIKLR